MRTISIAAFALCLASSAWAGEAAKAKPPEAKPEAKAEEFVKVTASGSEALGSGGGAEVTATAKAKEQALREAVKKVAGVFITSMTNVKEATLMSDVVSAHTAGYVRTYKELKSEVVDDVATVTIEAEVGKAQLDKDAAAVRTLIAQKGQRRVYVSIADSSAETVGTKGQAQAVAVVRHGVFDGKLRESLRQDGFTCLDPNMVDGKLKQKSAIQAIGTPQEANEIATAIGADVVIYGTATISTVEDDVGESPTAKGQRIVVYGASVRTAIVVTTTDSGEAIADFTDVTVGKKDFVPTKAVDRTMDEAAKKTLTQVRVAFFDAWRKQLTSGQRVHLSISGLRDFGAFTAFKELLKSNVSSCKDVASARFQKNSATMELTLLGSTENLAGELEGKNFKGQIINVLKVGGSTIELALGK